MAGSAVDFEGRSVSGVFSLDVSRSAIGTDDCGVLNTAAASAAVAFEARAGRREEAAVRVTGAVLLPVAACGADRAQSPGYGTPSTQR